MHDIKSFYSVIDRTIASSPLAPAPVLQHVISLIATLVKRGCRMPAGAPWFCVRVLKLEGLRVELMYSTLQCLFELSTRKDIGGEIFECLASRVFSDILPFGHKVCRGMAALAVCNFLTQI